MDAIQKSFWLVCIGLAECVLLLIGAFVLFITIVGQEHAVRLAKLALRVLTPPASGVKLNVTKHAGANILWLIVLGWLPALYALIMGFFMCFTLVGIKLGLKAFRLSAAMAFPFGAQII